MTDINVKQTNCNVKAELVNDSNIDILLPAALVNAIVNLSFSLDGEPVTDGVTGTLGLTGRYKNGRSQTLAGLDISSINSFKISGKFTTINATLISLTGADTVVINVDQNINMV